MKEKECRPYIICHMVTSIDGKVTGNYLSNDKIKPSIDLYYKMHKDFNFDGFICGRVTMESSFTNYRKEDLSIFKNKKINREDYIGKLGNFYAVSFDRYGKVFWDNNTIFDEDEGYNNSVIIEVLTEKVSDEFLCYLQSKNISYIFAGIDDIDVNIALNKLKTLFNINKLLLEGGSIINGAFLKSNCIDELSLVIAPINGEKEDKPLFYEGDITTFNLISVKAIGQSIYVRYLKDE